MVVLAYPILAWPEIARLNAVSYTPLRETAAVLKTAHERGAVICGYGFGADALQYYFPKLIVVRDLERLRGMLAQALSERRELCVGVGYEELNRQRLPAGFTLLDQPGQFVEISRLPGLEKEFQYRVMSAQPPGS